MAQDGYTAPFVLQDILAQKRAQQHQKLIDSLNLVQTQAEMENQAKRQQQDAVDSQATADFRTKTLADNAADRASREKIAAMPGRESQPGIVQEYEYAKKNGYTKSFSDFQNEDANRKRPVTPRDTGTYVGPATGPDGKPVPGKHVVMQNGVLRVVDTPGFGLGAKPSAAGADKGPSPAEFINLAKLAGAAATGPDRMFGMRAGKPADPKAVAAYTQALNNIVTRYNAPREVVEGVLAALQEDPNVPTQQILDAQASSGATPEELAKFRELLVIARGQ